MNAYFMEAEEASCSTYCEGCLACLTAYLMYICVQTHFEKVSSCPVSFWSCCLVTHEYLYLINVIAVSTEGGQVCYRAE